MTYLPERLEWLTYSLLGIPAFQDAEKSNVSDAVAKLRYQLFTAVAGTLLEAQVHATTAILLIHEFRTQATDDAKLQDNAEAFNEFLRLFYSRNGGPDEPIRLGLGEMLGPISVVARSMAGLPVLAPEIPLFIGKVRTDCLTD